MAGSMTIENDKTLEKVQISLVRLLEQMGAFADRLVKLENKLDSHYASREALERVTDKLSTIEKMLTEFKETAARESREYVRKEQLEVLVERVRRNEETLTWATRSIIASAMSAAVAALTYLMKH
jgi:alkylhydroperoxidase/carboxymuconolactone decarboxylase family protein YurZ